MDSVSQFVLGASVGLAISPKKSPKIAIIAGILATVPDLDVLIDYGDDISNMINHRGFSHSVFILSLFCLPLAWSLQKIWTNTMSYCRWLIFCLGVLLTHPMLDSLTIFGTQLFWPLELPSAMIGSMFVVDLFYTAPLLLGFVVLMIKKHSPTIAGYLLNTWVLSISTLYLVLSLILQSYVLDMIKLPIHKADVNNTFVMPTPFNLLLWRVVVVDKNRLYENFYHLYKGAGSWIKTTHQQHKFNLSDDSIIQKYKHFSHGFYRLDEQNDKLILSDVRMGTTTMPIFSFEIAKKQKKWQMVKPRSVDFVTFNFSRMFGDQDLF